MIKKPTLRLVASLSLLFAVLAAPVFVFAQVTTQGGGTGSTSPSGILNGVTGNLHLQTLKIGTGLTFDGTTLAANGGSSASSTLLIDSNTFSGTINKFTNAPAVGVSGLLKGNGSSAITAAANGTDFTLLTANTCGAGQFFNSATAAGVLGCGTPAGTSYTGTFPIIVTGSVISSGYSTTTNTGLGQGFRYIGPGGIDQIAASSSLNLPNSALQNSSLTVNGQSISLGGSGTVTANTTNAVTFNSSGSGGSSPQVFNGSSAETISYNTIGAQVAGTYVTGVTATAPIFSSGGTTPNLTWAGLATTSQPASSNLLTSNGAAGVYGTATSTLSATAPLTGSFTQVGSGGTLGCQTASGSQAGCLSSTDWNTFNSKSGFGYPFTPTAYGNLTTSATSSALYPYALIAATSTFGTILASTSITIQPLATAAGTFLAADPTGKIIATTTPISTGGSTEGVNWATTGVLAGTPTYSNGTLGVGATLTEIGTGALSVDSNSPATNDRVLVKNQASAFQNGIYVVTATGSGIASYILTRSTDYNSNTEITPGLTTYVLSGTANLDTTWAVNFTVPLTMGTTNLNYTLAAGTGSAISSLGPLNQLQTGATQTLATSSSVTIQGLTVGLTITATGNTQTFTPTFTGSLTGTAAGLSIGGLAGTATALAANGTNCSAGNAPLGVDASGNSEGCFAVSTFGYPFTPLAFGSITTSATSSALYPAGGLVTGTSTIGTLVASSSITNQAVKSALVLNGAGGLEGAYAGSNPCSATQAALSISATGVITCTNVSTFSYPFTPSTFGINVSATSTPLYPSGLITGTSTIGTLVASSSITNQSVKSALVLNGSGGLEGAYGGAADCTNQFVTALSATGGTTCTSLTSSNVTTALGFTPFGGTNPLPLANGGSNTTSFTTSGNAVYYDGTRLATALTTAAVTTPFASSTVLSITQSAFFATSGGNVGIASTTPWSRFSVGTGLASSSITVAEYKYGANGNNATSTAASLACNTSNHIAWPIGFSATTLTLTNFIPGQSCTVTVQNPNGTAGALTWAIASGAILKWTGGAVPTQTTAANQFDIYSFLASQGSSTIEVVGAGTLNN